MLPYVEMILAAAVLTLFPALVFPQFH